jgi:hypothetical protein
MMTIYKYTIRTWLILRYYFHWLSRTGCFGSCQAIRFSPGNGDKSGSTIRAGLFRHHVKQFHESSCSVASVVSAVNALLEKTRGPQAYPLTQRTILEKVRAAHWKERMGPNGYKGRRGLPLTILGEVVRASLDAYGLPEAKVEVIQAGGGRDSVKVKNRLLTLLKEFQSKDNCLLIAHFDQGSYVRELNIPHISPVGGFDPATGLVTILDVDPCQTRPYKIPFRTFYKGISTNYGGVFSLFDYGRGGVVLIRLNQRSDKT